MAYLIGGFGVLFFDLSTEIIHTERTIILYAKTSQLAKMLPQVLKSKTPKVYKNGKLNNANFGNFTLNDYQVFLHLVSKIGGVDERGKYLQPKELKREYTLTAKEFCHIFNLSLKDSYRVLKKAVDKLMKSEIQIQKPYDLGLIRINVCSMAEYTPKEGTIRVEFTDRIMPYLGVVSEFGI